MPKIIVAVIAALFLATGLFATPSVTSFSTGTSGGGTGTMTITAPTSIVNGNCLVSAVGYIVGPIVPPAGWTTAVAGFGAGLSSLVLFQKTASSESGNYTFTSSGGDFISGGIVNVAGNAATCMDVVGTGNTGTGTTATALSITTTKTNDLILFFQSNDGVGSEGIPAGFTPAGEIDGGVSQGYAAGYLVQAAIGATGNKTAATQTPWCAVMVAVAGSSGPAAGSRMRMGFGK